MLIVAVVALAAGLVYGVTSFETAEDQIKGDTFSNMTARPKSSMGATLVANSNPHTTPKSAVGEYRFAAVAADAGPCSRIGTFIMAERGGSAVDAALAALLCLELHSAQSVGSGGGFFMLIYDKPRVGKRRRMFALDARETAPLAATRDMSADGTSLTRGGKAIGVPGQIAGFYEAWKKFGKLPWKDLFAPAIAICREGFTVQRALNNAIKDTEEAIRNEPSLAEVFLKPNGELYKTGDTMRRPVLGDTLEIIAKEGPEAYYNGSLSGRIIADIQDHGGIITLDDLREYKAVWRQPSKTILRSRNLTVNTMPAPSSGPVLQYMLNILDGYDLRPSDIQGIEAKSRTYHRIVETFKFGFAERTFLADPSFEDVQDAVSNLTSRKYADATRERIIDDVTHPVEYYNPSVHTVMADSGTSHLCIVGPDGEAVSVTATINDLFGSERRGRRTGIIFNNEMRDFSTPGDQIEYGLSSAQANFIEPGKRPLSSMAPTILTDLEGEVVTVLGGSGGSKILTSVTFVAAHAIWLGKPLHVAIDTPRIHDRLIPNELDYEPEVEQVSSTHTLFSFQTFQTT